jgi:hypothetical protein
MAQISKNGPFSIGYLSDLLRLAISREIVVEMKDEDGKFWNIGIWSRQNNCYQYSDDLNGESLTKFIVDAATEALTRAIDESKLVPKGNK